MKLYIKNMYTKDDINKVSAVLSGMNIRYDENIVPGELVFIRITCRKLWTH